jgi:PIN domain nuclease of toxin-antitoxin system
VRLLVDTHFLVWWAAGRRIPKQAASIIQDPANEIYASAASVWEIAIKVGLGRLDVDPAELARALDDGGFKPLPVTAHHAIAVAALPAFHRDPFDRLLVAQSKVEHLSLLTQDKVLAEYGAMVIQGD